MGVTGRFQEMGAAVGYMSTKSDVANGHARTSTVYQKVDLAANNDMAVTGQFIKK